MKLFTKYLLPIAAVVLAACGGNESEEHPADEFDVRIELPATADVTRGGELSLKVRDGKAPLTTDSFLLEGGGNFAPLPYSEDLFREF